MNTSRSNIDASNSFDEQKVILELKKYLPSQAPLKDFIFQNNLDAFQSFNFFDGISNASKLFGYKVFLSLIDFRELYKKKKIREDILDKVITDDKGAEHFLLWKEKLISATYNETNFPLVGRLRSLWNDEYKVNIDSLVHPILFRMLCCYLDQGISIWNFPIWKDGFLLSVKEMERNSFTSFFNTERPRKLLLEGNYDITYLLNILVGDEAYYEQYLFDQQFAHQGWSGMVSFIENNPESLMDEKDISIKELITIELLLEIDAIDSQLGKNWKPLCINTSSEPLNLFAQFIKTELHEVYALWQKSYEWSYYDEVLAGLHQAKNNKSKPSETKSFQSLFCIDDRETSFRDYLESTDPNCETFGTPGFFNVEFYFRPEHGKALTKLCPAPVIPKYLIKEIDTKGVRKKAHHFSKQTFSLSAGWLISQTLGFWSAIELAIDIFKPSSNAASVSSFNHMDKDSQLTIENTNTKHVEHGLQVGFSIEEMAIRVEGLLRSIGLIKDFAPIIYVIGHGASSVNNPYYATMDCGACSCRPGSVNARVFSSMANNLNVRKILEQKGLSIPPSTQFVGGLHDTTRDEICYFDDSILNLPNQKNHQVNKQTFSKALELNAKERSRRFDSINTADLASTIHKKIKTRSVSLFEPRPELDHANNAITIIGRRVLTKKLFLDRRSFMNSYDYSTDLDGTILSSVLKPIAPVCGGINLSYYFSKVDNKKLGSGTKLPHNVMGLIGVANGIDGDLRHGLPSQMIESHDPLRHMVIVEHFPNVLLNVLIHLPTYNWFYNNWMHIIAFDPETKEFYLFNKGKFELYTPLLNTTPTIEDITPILESSNSQENIPIYIIS